MGLFNKIGNIIFKGMMHSAGVECLNPYIGLLLQANEEDLIADELYRLSLTFQHGEYGLSTDKIRAEHYCKLAAEKGHVVAQLFMAMWTMRQQDDGTEEVLKWLQKAASQGEKQALYNLGISYHRGDFGNVDINKANELIRKSAEKGYGPAQSRMAILYLNGEGSIPANKDIAKFFAMNGHFLHDETSSEILVSLLTDEERKKSEIDIDSVLQNARSKGEPLAEIAYITQHFAEDNEKIMYLEAANKCNCSRFDDVLGILYWRNEMFDKAFSHLRTAAEDGFPTSQFMLADMFYFGKGVEKNIKKALYWVEKSLNYGDNNARILFARMIMNNDLQEILPDKVMRGAAYLELANVKTN